MSLDIVITIYNESRILEKSIIHIYKKIKKIIPNNKFNFILVENGSTDESLRKIYRLKKKFKNISVYRRKKSNYGASLKQGCIKAKNDFILIMNIDHLWDDHFFKWSWKHKINFDVIIGSKRSDPFLNKQTRYRKILSGILNFILSFFLNSVFADTHGMKMINRKKTLNQIKLCRLSRGQFDTELMLRLARNSYKIAEIPIPYIEKRNPRNFMLIKILQNIFYIIKLIKILKKIKVNKPVNYRRYNRHDVINLYV